MAIKIEKSDVAGGIHKIKLTGALDIAGAAEAEMPMSVAAGSSNKVIVDMSGVSFLASIGIRVLVATARTIHKRGGRLVLFGTSEDARKVLRSTGIDAIIPSVANEAAAVAECNK